MTLANKLGLSKIMPMIQIQAHYMWLIMLTLVVLLSWSYQLNSLPHTFLSMMMTYDYLQTGSMYSASLATDRQWCLQTIPDYASTTVSTGCYSSSRWTKNSHLVRKFTAHVIKWMQRFSGSMVLILRRQFYNLPYSHICWACR